MKPGDPRVRALVAVARRPLAGVVAASATGAVLVIGQAFAVTALLLSALRGDPLLTPAALVVGVIAARALAGLASDVLAARAAALVGVDLRQRLTRAAIDRSPMAPDGATTALVTRGVTAVEPYVTRYLPAVVVAGVLPLLTVVVIATQDLLSAVIVAATLPLLPVFGALVGLATRDRAEAQWRAMASLSGHFVDVMRGLPTLVAFRRAKAQSATIRAITDRYRVATMRTLRIAFASSAVLELVATLSVALVAVVVGVRLASGGLDLGTGLVVLLLAPEAYWPLRRVGVEFHAAAEGVAAFEQASALLSDHPHHGGSRSARGPIVVNDLTVTYPGRSTPALQGLSATIPERGLTAVVGPSGCGKSTFLAALMGLVGPLEPDPSWQELVSWVPQRPMFSSGTVAENLRIASPDASDDVLWAALREVGLDERVRRLRGGLDAPLGEDAGVLSAGERARLALARVIVAARPWVFLDEPTAHLDAVSEAIILDTLTRLAESSGVVVVAHRDAVLERAHHVIRIPAAAQPPVRVPTTSTPPAVRRVTVGQVPVDPAPARFTASTVLAAAASASGVALTATAGWLIVKASEHPAVLTMLVAIVGVRAFGLARPVLRYAERLRGHDAALRLLAERRVAVYDGLVPLAPGRLGRRRGDLLASLVDDVDSVLDRELRVRLPLRSGFLVVLAAAGVAAYLLPVAALVVLAVAAVGLVGYLVARTGSRRAEARAVAVRAELSGRLLEALQLAPETVMWQAQPRAVAGVTECARDLGAASVASGSAVATARSLVLAGVGVAVAAMAVLASDAHVAGLVSGPMLALLVLLPLALADVVLPWVESGGLEGRTGAAQQRLDELVGRTPAVREPASPEQASGESGVTVRDLSASWGGEPVLRDLSLDLPAGARVAVVGPSGSGKSTLAALLLRFIDPAHGSIRLGRVPLTRLPLDEVRREVGLVDDDPHVFATTVAENVRLARPGASDAEVDAALHRARLGPWLATLPDRAGTLIGEGYAEVSGGERARLALARSLLGDQPVLVLDEPTAHLDGATAEAVAADLLDSADGRSIVWITHGRAGLDRIETVLELPD